MSRNYSRKNSGGSNISPTGKQRTQTSYVEQKKDVYGNKEVQHQSLLSKQLIIRDFQKIPPDKIQQILDAGMNTHEYRTILAHELLRGFEKNKNWKGKDVMNEKGNPRSAEEIIKLLTMSAGRGENEIGVVYDKYGRFLGLTMGRERSVAVTVTTGTAIDGHFYHTHPSAESNGRLGHSFSAADVNEARNLAVRSMNAIAKEGLYRLEAQKNGWKSVNPAKVKALYTKLEKSDARVAKIARDAFGYVKDPKQLMGIREYRDYYNRLLHHETEKVMSSWAKSNKVSYSFTPNKGYETLTNIKDIHKPLP